MILLLNFKNIALSKVKAIKLHVNVGRVMEFAFDRIENIVGKREDTG